MGKIKLNNMEFHVHLGAYRPERKLKQRLVVSIDVDYDFSKAAAEDDLHETVNYEDIVRICNKVVEEPKSLLETVAVQIANDINEEFPEITRIEVSIKKPEVQLGVGIDEVEISYVID